MKAKKRNAFIKKNLESKKRRLKKIVVHIAHSWEEGEKWDIEYWQKFSPQQRISAVESLRKELEAIRNARK